jgi:hypothetical protein
VLDQLERVGDLLVRAERGQPFGFDEIGNRDVRVAGGVGESARVMRDSGGVEGARKRTRQVKVLRIDDAEP